MELILTVILIWNIHFINGNTIDESLSFSNPIDQSTPPTSSFWHGSIPVKLFEKDLELKILVNKPQGLLFYAIDNLYQTFSIEIQNTRLLIRYYNFREESIDPFIYEANKLCGVEKLEDSILSLMFSLKGKNLKISCNNHNETAFYSPSVDSISDDQMNSFFKNMKNPVPFFNASSTTQIWIGNTPNSIENHFRNTALQEQSKPLLGCVESLKVDNSPVRLSTSGTRHGNMIEPSCKRVCGTNPCLNGGRCYERWRERFKCECGLSGFLGRVCNESFAVGFDGTRTVNVVREFKFVQLQISFKLRRSFGSQKSYAIFSIAFTLDKNLYVYVGSDGNLNIKYTNKDYNEEKKFYQQIRDNRNYMLIIDVDSNGFHIKLAYTEYRKTISEVNIKGDFINFVTASIFVGGSHSDSMDWMNRFKGCISNLVLTGTKKIFNWNEIPDFKTLPTCVKKVASNKTQRVSKPYSKVTPLPSQPKPSVRSASMPYIIIGVVVIMVLVIIIIVVVYRHKRVHKREISRTKLNNHSDNTHSFDAMTYQTYVPPSYSPIQYKPPYKAGSFSQSSNFGKSINSLPSSMTATLVTPEDGDC